MQSVSNNTTRGICYCSQAFKASLTASIDSLGMLGAVGDYFFGWTCKAYLTTPLVIKTFNSRFNTESEKWTSKMNNQKITEFNCIQMFIILYIHMIIQKKALIPIFNYSTISIWLCYTSLVYSLLLETSTICSSPSAFFYSIRSFPICLSLDFTSVLVPNVSPS